MHALQCTIALNRPLPLIASSFVVLFSDLFIGGRGGVGISDQLQSLAVDSIHAARVSVSERVCDDRIDGCATIPH
jgi:hypothetical protein